MAKNRKNHPTSIRQPFEMKKIKDYLKVIGLVGFVLIMVFYIFSSFYTRLQLATNTYEGRDLGERLNVTLDDGCKIICAIDYETGILGMGRETYFYQKSKVLDCDWENKKC